MPMQSNKISFKGQKVYVGIDVHLKKWHVTCITESNFKRTIEQPADAEALKTFLERNFRDADYYAAYEAPLNSPVELESRLPVAVLSEHHGCAEW